MIFLILVSNQNNMGATFWKLDARASLPAWHTHHLLEAKKNPKDRDWYKDEDEDKLEDAKADEEADENQYIFACN